MLSRWNLPLRNLRYFGLANGLIVLGVIIGTAVLTGALLLGDSLKGSLAQLTLDRLGAVDAAVVSEQFFPASLAGRLEKQSRYFQKITPIILLRGTVLRRRADGGKLLARAGHVQIVGVSNQFWNFFQDQQVQLPDDGVIINQALAEALQAQPRDGLEIRLEKPLAVPAESLLGNRNEDAALVIETSPVSEILPNRAAGRFTLHPQHDEPLILYVKLERLQRRLSKDQQAPPQAANVLLATLKSGSSPPNSADSSRDLNQTLTLEDSGFTLRRAESNDACLVLETTRLLLDAESERLILDQCRQAGLQTMPTFSYLANRTFRIDPADDKKMPSKEFTPYSSIIALAPETLSLFGSLLDPQGKPLPALGEGDILINSWLAQDLWPDRSWRSALGQRCIRIEYFVESDGHKLIEKQHDFRLAGVVEMNGLATDRTLTPEFPGMKGTRIADWDPPFPKAQWHPEWIRSKDEQYYKQFRATPKLFVHPGAAHRLFTSRFGSTTAIRITKPSTSPSELEQQVRELLSPKLGRLTWQMVKDQGLRAATAGGTANMFGGLFAGFSLFLIVSAALLVGLLFRLRIERRAREIGLLLAQGWTHRKIRHVLVWEGLLLSLLGALLGIPAALGYAWVMIRLIRLGWGGLLASDTLTLYFGPPTLITGALLSVLIASLAIIWSLRGLVKLPVTMLLAGRATPSTLNPQNRKKWVNYTPIVFGLGAAFLLYYGISLPPADRPGTFYGSGFLCLLALVFTARLLLIGRFKSATLHAGLWRFGKLNAARSPNRSLLTIALLAAGCFMVIAVGAFRKQPGDDNSLKSGAGGFTLLAQADLPLRSVPHQLKDWREVSTHLGPEISPELLEKLDNVELFGFRLRSGDDVSCLNLYQPARPQVLGVPETFARRDGFTLQLWDHATPEELLAPWTALSRRRLNSEISPEAPIPVFLDDHTAQWVMQKKLGEIFGLADETGKTHDARIVGIIQGSIFQSEILIGEENFRLLYPGEAGYRFFLIDAPGSQTAQVRASLESLLGESHGLVVRTTASRLASFQAVENTYIGTFQFLGGLGLLLGTAGVGIVILRNVQERQSELALFQAVGFSRRDIATTILAEVGWLVFMGMMIGALSALLVIAPHLTSGMGSQLLIWLTLVLALVPLVALLASALGIRLTLRMPLIPSLRAE